MAAPYPTIRLLSGAIASFGPGASVVSCDLLSSLSCLLLNATFSSAAITPDDVKAIFASMELDDVTVITIHTVDTPIQDAVYVTLRGRNEAQNLVEAFNERTEGKGEGPFRYGHAKTVPPRLPPGTSPVRHISQRVVRISWQRPFSQLWLHFESEETAQRVYRTLDKYNLEPRKDSVSEPRLHIFQPPGADSRFLVSWQIGVSSGRQGLSPQSVREVFAKADQPSRIKIGPDVENTFDEEAALAAVLDLMTPFGGEEGHPAHPWNYNNRTHMNIHFKSEGDARRAMQELSSTERDFLGGQTMRMQIVSSAQIRVPTYVYNMIGKEMIRVVPNGQQTLSIEVDIDFRANSRFKRIKITGTDEREVAEAMKKMEEVIAGKVINDETGLPFWHTLLTDSRVAKTIEKEMEHTHGVLVMANKFKRELRYFGPVSMFEGVRKDLVELITSSTKERFCFHLDRDEFLWMRREGYGLLKSTIGDKAVSFDAKVKPHAVLFMVWLPVE
ncbi:hypothetical protein TI39_contig4248g00006 [Zymoseptoria brevis]|uniref:Uncharacterized protein n=1 Tax=Zymoseptoria brevis TaxID=1047168 RepID=A0A0F4G8Z0_9PEZI|nr:hypothetical protein TI39_contig4248g00006 [Zymoseptoria brevis]